ncbi:hypothetical protein P4388_29685 [Bacillus thuringiensis]|uniref:Uncharacterized protein n=2 Tax=Bacillus cereus group TaxID=86661 RepID=A0A1B2RCK3_BACTU|nr:MULTISPECIES: hypothetical protein [Bacillus]AOB42229.1 hypothetical protein pFR260_132c [Bacillus thuringiensis]EJR73053.1 hypothetical protein IK9_05373 [Bacillus cereus VD166]MBJ7968037.1 hypothetical protein [Bacillus cereus]MBJ8004421.1 hypothetical protein [Bacillus cereus]MBN9901200.1 hypothetical protein [Bacillus thuringiensis]
MGYKNLLKKKTIPMLLVGGMLASTGWGAGNAYADSPTATEAANSPAKFAGVTSPLDTSSADFEVLYSETVKFDENENVINREVSGTETRTSNTQGVIIADGSFNWKHASSKDSSNRINKDSYNVGLILVNGLSSYIPWKPVQVTAQVVASGLMYFNQPSITYYHTEAYRDIDAVNHYVKTVTDTIKNGKKVYTDTKVMKYTK